MIIDATEYDDSDDEEQALLDELAEWSRLEDAKAAPRGRPADDAAKIRTKLRVLRAALRACTSPRRRVALRERIHAERAWLDRLSAGVDASARRGHAREPSNGSDWSFFSHGTTGEGGSFHAPSPPRLFRFSADHARQNPRSPKGQLVLKPCVAERTLWKASYTPNPHVLCVREVTNKRFGRSFRSAIGCFGRSFGASAPPGQSRSGSVRRPPPRRRRRAQMPE